MKVKMVGKRKLRWSVNRVWSEGIFHALESHCKSNNLLFTKLGIANLFLEKFGFWDNAFLCPGNDESKQIYSGKVKKITQESQHSVILKVIEMNTGENPNQKTQRWSFGLREELGRVMQKIIKENDYLFVWGEKIKVERQLSSILLNETGDSVANIIIYRHEAVFEPNQNQFGVICEPCPKNSHSAWFQSKLENETIWVQRILPYTHATKTWELISSTSEAEVINEDDEEFQSASESSVNNSPFRKADRKEKVRGVIQLLKDGESLSNCSKESIRSSDADQGVPEPTNVKNVESKKPLVSTKENNVIRNQIKKNTSNELDVIDLEDSGSDISSIEDDVEVIDPIPKVNTAGLDVGGNIVAEDIKETVTDTLKNIVTGVVENESQTDENSKLHSTTNSSQNTDIEDIDLNNIYTQMINIHGEEENLPDPVLNASNTSPVGPVSSQHETTDKFIDPFEETENNRVEELPAAEADDEIITSTQMSLYNSSSYSIGRLMEEIESDAAHENSIQEQNVSPNKNSKTENDDISVQVQPASHNSTPTKTIPSENESNLLSEEDEEDDSREWGATSPRKTDDSKSTEDESNNNELEKDTDTESSLDDSGKLKGLSRSIINPELSSGRKLVIKVKRVEVCPNETVFASDFLMGHNSVSSPSSKKRKVTRKIRQPKRTGNKTSSTSPSTSSSGSSVRSVKRRRRR